MEWLLDSAEHKEWERVSVTGLFSAITTNPLLLNRAGLKVNLDTYERLTDRALALGYEHIQLQVFGDNWEENAEKILSLNDQTIVKIPACEQGFGLVKRLNAPHRTTITGVYASRMGAAAERLGVRYVAAYYARLVESDRNADRIFEGLRMSCKNTGVLVASLRSVDQFEHLIGLGHRCFTIPGALLDPLLCDEMTEAAIVQFEQAARAV